MGMIWMLFDYLSHVRYRCMLGLLYIYPRHYGYIRRYIRHYYA